MSDFIQKAWDAVKGEGDLPYAESSPILKDDLANRADGIIRTGVTNREAMGGSGEESVYDKFEAEFKRLHDKGDAKPEPKKASEEPVPETDAPAVDEDVVIDDNNVEDLHRLSRAELDKIAQDEFGFNPSDFSNKGEIVAAIEKARSK